MKKMGGFMMKDTSIMKLQKLDYIIRRAYVVALIIGATIPIVEGFAIGFIEDRLEEFEKIQITIILIYLFILNYNLFSFYGNDGCKRVFIHQ